jgi:paraquat-inducible protein A
MIAVAALIAVVCGMLLPFMSMSQFGVEREFSLIGGIVELARRGHGFLGALLFAFSVVFPIAKLAFILAATSSLVRMSMRARRKLRAVAMATGKYSLLDVLVIAVMIVLIKFDGLVTVEARAGTIVFCVAILLSILAGLCVDLGPSEVRDGGG